MKIIKKLLERFKKYGIKRTLTYSSESILRRLPPKFGTFWYQLLAKTFALARKNDMSVVINDVPLYIDSTNSWALRTYVFGPTYNFHEISMVKELVPQRYTFLDIGANFGVWSFSLADHFEKIIAIEPDPRCFSRLVRTKEELGYGNVSVVNVALSDCNRQGELFLSPTHEGDSRIYEPGDDVRLSGIPVQLESLDSLTRRLGFPAKELFIKLDVQGVEMLVINGMLETLKSVADCMLFVEIQESVLKQAGALTTDLLGLLRKMNFVPVDIFSGLKETDWSQFEVSNVDQDYCFRYSNATQETSLQNQLNKAQTQDVKR